MQNGIDTGVPANGSTGWQRLVSRMAGLGLPRILLLAGLLRLLWLWLCPNQPVSDQHIYHQAAIALARGEGFVETSGQPHGWWPVGYSAALAPFYWLFGDAPRIGHGANLLFGLATVFALHRLALALAGPAVAAVAALLLALHPTAIVMTTVHALENLYIPIVLGALAVLVRFGPGPGARWRAVLVTGLLLGLGAYVRAPSLLLLTVVPLWLLLIGIGFWRTLLPTLAAAVVALVVLLPWGFRTQHHFGTFQLVSMNGMSNLWMGNHPGSDGGYHELPADVAALSVPDREKELGARAIAFIREQPVQYLLRCARRCVMTLRSDTIAVSWSEPGLLARGLGGLVTPLKAITSAAFYLVGAAALWSLWRRRRALDRVDLLLVAVLAVLAFPFVAIVGGNRYHLPLGPVLVLLAARGLAGSPPR
ncbi:MAG: glycosyltransferase family 39 protein [Planctomycetes bacterium]|jgi:4-amino-4-deoxy-L-arabinose transferase-like glycosyltransferase|nr:glycosyltransferase family 39 protein [Planctomycetota bacterium]